MADCMVHLGNYSLGKMAGLYPDCRHVLIPHPIYLGAYDDTLTREAAREYWGIDRRTFVVTAFGKFRRRDEVWMTLKAFSLCLEGRSSCWPQECFRGVIRSLYCP